VIRKNKKKRRRNVKTGDKEGDAPREGGGSRVGSERRSHECVAVAAKEPQGIGDRG